jgi:two-component system cell cycle response regulator
MMNVGLRTVLVVEDHEDIRELLRLQLTFDGLEVLECATGEEALELVQMHAVDAVLLDAELPGISGYDVLAQLAGSAIPVVVISGRTTSDDVVEAFRLGAHDHIAKPFRGKELRARVTAAVELKRRHDALRHENLILGSESRSDTLTGLANRRKLEADLQILSSSARRHDHPFSVALVDVDHFKAVNDTYGHGAGDQALRTIAERLEAALRVEDVAGRWGGEEFLVLLPYTDLEGAHVVGERLRHRVGGDPILLDDGSLLRVSISIGIADGTDVGDLLSRADAALYRAKAAGRNLVLA